MPAALRCYDPTDWGAEPSADGDDPAAVRARDAWYAARFEWGADHGLTPLDILRLGLNDRRRAAGQAPI